MSKEKNQQTLQNHKSEALSQLNDFISSLIDSQNTHDRKRADLLSYWIKDYVKFLRKEETFEPEYLIKYKKGDIVKMHLGYRLGSEEGGVHFGIVLDLNNNKKSDTVTILPLTSKKPGKKFTEIQLI